MKIATYNVNGINGRLPVLLRWLEESQPDVVCLQELKAPDAKFPVAAINDAGYGAIWHGQKSWNGVAILAKGMEPVETRRGLPGDKSDSHSRYLEAAVEGVLIACLYLPNGNPAPGPKLEYKLKWFDRLLAHASDLLAQEIPVVLAGDFNVIPTELDLYRVKGWEDDALFRPEVRAAYARLLEQGWTDSIRHLHPDERVYTFWDYLRNAWARDAGLRLDHLLLSPHVSDRLVAAEVDREVRGWDHASDHAPAWIELRAVGRKRKAGTVAGTKSAGRKPEKAAVSRGRLEEYGRKRDFNKTPEPEPEIPRKPGNSYVIQEHHAKGHHFDIRLEIDGVLVSWAVPKGIPEELDVRRLAVHTEDHPVEYGKFQGEIPKGSYGAGKMTIWDSGEWEPLETGWRKQFAKGTLKFHLKGQRLRAPFILARMKEEPNWMLMKLNPATHPAPTASVENETPGFIPPQLAHTVASVPRGPGWVHELKFDGYRLIIVKKNRKVTIFTRNGHDWTDRFAGIVRHVAALAPEDFILDGEAVVFDEKGHTNFGDLQAALGNSYGRHPKRKAVPDKRKAAGSVTFIAFDLLHFDGLNLRGLPLRERQQRLSKIVDDVPGATITRSRVWPAEMGADLFKQACAQGLEGVISKPLDGSYAPESRGEWTKSKCRPRQEFVICGYTQQKGDSHNAFGALILASEEEGVLVHRGRVGTGFSERSSAELLKIFKPLVTRTASLKIPDKGITWLKPRLVAEVEFAQITRDGLIRQGSFIALREDKSPEDVHLDAVLKAVVSPDAKQTSAMRNKNSGGKPVVQGIAISHPDRVVYPADGITKLEVAEYYERVGKLMLPFITKRPLALLRAPSGIQGELFFQKSFNTHVPAEVFPARMPDGDEVFSIKTITGLVSLAQFGAIEFHPWGAPLPGGEKPDFLTWDLDPDSKVAWPEVLGAALLLRDYLAEQGLESLVKTSGGKGIHIILPIKRKHGWDLMKPFTKAVAAEVAAFNPKRFIIAASKSKREGRIFIDWLRNGEGATCVAPWCLRARPGAPVSMPLAWEDLATLPPGGGFTIRDEPKLPDQWKKPKFNTIPARFLKNLGII
ncbi:DNA ligase D [Luteolibacter yonseiensis]|uniref:DNA ligase (ATP) n=1 Tax=Luteolibacter yonseiensis TaxID=1144680 RepID=A0A934RAZ4_9BACT|nr:DNA ligase D [Luteolibacter yonseiensis]MBK1818254.1 DNA ligase D [Luteolibacter yonseiensis]